ncbi:MAG: hypothetical protein GY946_30770 [bacterium]|nr:hypothetical protein [bacterium]
MLDFLKITICFLFVSAGLSLDERRMDRLRWACFHKLNFVAMSNGLRPRELLAAPELVETAMHAAWSELGPEVLVDVGGAMQAAREAGPELSTALPTALLMVRAKEWLHPAPV